MAAKHCPATLRIQSRLERLELQHLREHAAELAERVEQLERDLRYAEDLADFWSRSHHDLAEHLNDGTADARAIGLTQRGEVLVVSTAAEQSSIPTFLREHSA